MTTTLSPRTIYRIQCNSIILGNGLPLTFWTCGHTNPYWRQHVVAETTVLLADDEHVVSGGHGKVCAFSPTRGVRDITAEVAQA